MGIKIITGGLDKVDVMIVQMRSWTLIDLVFDGAKISFGCPNDRTRKRHNANPICTIGAMGLGNPIEVLEFLAIKDDEIFAQ